MNSQRLFNVMMVPLFSIVVFQGCTGSQFSVVNQSEKEAVLDEHAGFGNDPIDEGIADLGDDGESGNPSNPPNTKDDSVPGDPGVPGAVDPNPDDVIVDTDNSSTPDSDPTKPTDPVMPNPDTQDPDSPVVDTDNPIEPDSDTTEPGMDPLDPKNPQTPEVVTDKDKDPKSPVVIPSKKPKGKFDVIRWCRGKKFGATLSQATSVSIIVKNQNRVVCEAQGPKYLREMLNKGTVHIPNCDLSKIPVNKMVVLVYDQNGKPLSDGVDNATRFNAFNSNVVKSDDKRKPFQIHALHLLWFSSVKKKDALKCDAYNSSPLVVDMRSLSKMRRPILLTSPYDGVEFDILGENSYPAAHTPKHISWFKDPKIMPLVLPKNGSVDGIDQLFGDNTQGPDGRFADHGFGALAKYDKNKDKLITKKDPVFKKLRLWHDKNLNGISDRGELISLEKAGIEVIDLAFDSKYYKRDQYGNEIMFKSVVKFKNGQLRPVFDVWFAIYNNGLEKK